MSEAGVAGRGMGSRGRRFGHRLLPLLVWLGAIAGVVLLLPGTGRGRTIHGIVEAQRTAVVVPVDGTLVAVTVDRHERVQAGQVVGRLGDDDLRLRLAGARCELESLRADLRQREAEIAQTNTAGDARHQLDVASEMRRRTSELESARLDELETQAEIAEARIRLHGISVEVDRQSTLEKQGIAADAALVQVRTDQQALQKRIDELEGVLAERRARVAAARQRQEEFSFGPAAHLPVEVLLEPMRWRLKAQETELERIALEGRRLDLVAPATGSVEAVHVTPGQWVAGGTTLLTIVDSTANRILAYVPETARHRVQVASPVHVVRQGVPGRRPATVLSISPSVVLVPQRLWFDPRQEEWAWEVIVAGAGELPGERVTLLPE